MASWPASDDQPRLGVRHFARRRVMLTYGWIPPRRADSPSGLGDRASRMSDGDSVRKTEKHARDRAIAWTRRGEPVSAIEVSDVVTDAEHGFPIGDLLKCDYLARYRRSYYKARERGLLNPYRNYVTLLTSLGEIHAYNERHASGARPSSMTRPLDSSRASSISAWVTIHPGGTC